MATVAEHVPFLHFSKLCQKLSEKKGKEKKMKPLTDFIEYWRSFHLELHSANQDTADSFFSAMRLLLPQCERQRSAYGIKEFTLAKLLIEIFCLDKNGTDAQKLINYRSPKSANAEAGDFASVAYFVLKNRSPEKSTLTVHDINHYLDSIATHHGEKNKDDLKHDLLHLLRNTSALEQKWLIRIIVKDMKLGVSENSVLSAYHQDARDLFNVTNSLEKVCRSLKDSSVRLHEIEIELFSPFRPMLSEMALPNQVENLMGGQPFIVETKYDGERLQLHKDGSSYLYFSRGGFDCTQTYGSSPMQGSLTPYIHRRFKPDVQKCVLDGEIVIYSNKLNCIVSKGENADVQALQPDGEYAPCFCVFDVLLLNDSTLTNKPLIERSELIRKVFNPLENKIRLTEQLTFSTNAEVTTELNRAIDARLEGIVVKRPDSVYRPNIRKGGGWLKVKPEYIENLMDDLDLIIIGGYYGEGRRGNLVSHFLLAVASNEKIDGNPKCFYSFCKVGSGYTLRELHELSGKLEEHWQKYDPKRAPRDLVIGGGRKEQPDLWVEPSKSQILQVKASEINKSRSFATNCTLRFPRVERIRYDKAWTDCMTMEELEQLRNMAAGRLATRHTTGLEEEEKAEPESDPSPLKKPRMQRVVTVAAHFRPTDVSGVQQVSQLFKDKEFCMMFSSLQKKSEIEKQIPQHGGKFVQNPGAATWCVVCDTVTAKVRNVMSSGLYNVVKADWITSCVYRKSLKEWTPNDLIYATNQTADEMGEFYDKFGDSYTVDVTEKSLRGIFDNIEERVWTSVDLSTSKLAEMEEICFPESYSHGLFRRCRIFVASEDTEDFASSLISVQIRLHGGTLRMRTDATTTHIVIPYSNTLSVKELLILKKGTKAIFVKEKWIWDCIASNTLSSPQTIPELDNVDESESDTEEMHRHSDDNGGKDNVVSVKEEILSDTYDNERHSSVIEDLNVRVKEENESASTEEYEMFADPIGVKISSSNIRGLHGISPNKRKHPSSKEGVSGIKIEEDIENASTRDYVMNDFPMSDCSSAETKVSAKRNRSDSNYISDTKRTINELIDTLVSDDDVEDNEEDDVDADNEDNVMSVDEKKDDGDRDVRDILDSLLSF